MADFVPEQETQRLLRQSWDYPGGANMLAKEIASLFDVFFRTQTIGASFARLDSEQTFLQPNTFASTLFVAATGTANALDITHTGAGGFALKVFGREGTFYHGLLLGNQNASLNNGYAVDVQHSLSTSAMRILHGGASGFCLQTAGRPCISYDGYLMSQQTAGTYSFEVAHNVSGTAARIAHGLGGLALALVGGLTMTGDITVTGNITCTGVMTASSYVDT